MRIHRFKINELERDKGREFYWHYMRRFLKIYSKTEKEVWSGHFETIVKKHIQGDLFSARFHIGNRGSETPWDGHLIILGVGFYWGLGIGRKLANWLSRCSGYPYDTRDWTLRISDGRLCWEIANHDDMCEKHRIAWGRSDIISRGQPGTPGYGKKRRRPRKSLQSGSINISIPEAIWGPRRYFREEVDSFLTTIKMPEGEYGVILKLERAYLGRTKVPKHKHIKSWCIEVDSPNGIPTHFDKSGGWKGDRTYGFSVNFPYPRSEGWQKDAEALVTAWVYKQRGESGFREPQEV